MMYCHAAFSLFKTICRTYFQIDYSTQIRSEQK